MWNLRQCVACKLYESIIWGSRLLFSMSQRTVVVPKWFRASFSCCSNAGKVIFEWCKQVADDRDAPWSAQEPLSCQSAHVGHVRIVDWEAKDPDRETSQTQSNQQDGQNRGRHREIILRFWSLKELWRVVWRTILVFTYLSISVHQSMSSFSFM